MKFRDLGNTGLRLSEIGIGTWEMSGDVWGKKDDALSLRALEAGIEGGANFIDTGAGYGAGHVEELIGTFLRTTPRKREEIIICTKVKPQSGQFAPPPEKDIEAFYQPEWIRDQCEASLRRLGTDFVDILFLHTWSRSWGHETAWHDELSRLKDEGKVRAFGISIPDEGITDANVQVALKLVDTIQCVFSVFQQEPIYSLLPLAAKYGVGIIARSPFSSGVLVQDWSPDMKFPEGDWRGIWPLNEKPGWLEDQVNMAERVKPILSETGLTHSQAALGFVLASPEVSSVLAGSANPEHVAENLRASEVTLPANFVSTTRQLWLDRKVHGTYNGSI
jgi:aryl-alcohol dehydrogenase-like predicted oxidoreductase